MRFLWFLVLWTRKNWSFIWRGVLCWVLSFVFLATDEGSSFDRRFQLRGPRDLQAPVAVVLVGPEDLRTNLPRFKQEPDFLGSELTDSFYWDRQFWFELLQTILSGSPEKVGVSFFFAEDLEEPAWTPTEESIFLDPRIIWAGLTTNADRALYPLAAKYDRSNVGSVEILRDDDGVLRRFAPLHLELPHFVEKMSGIMHYGSRVINYRAQPDSILTIRASEMLRYPGLAQQLAGHRVLIGPEGRSASSLQTPLGPTNRAAYLAQLTENALTQSWILRFPFWAYVLALGLLEILCILLIRQYPHSVAFVSLLWLGTAWMAFSAWCFDTFSIWIPVVAPLLSILATWILFIGFRANEFERKNYQLKQDQQALRELEQLKNNFVSLISHDLKTPLAKIQSIIDRLSMDARAEPVQNELQNLREYSDELNRYLQSILKVLRVESSEFRLNLEVGDVNETIEKVVRQLAPLAKAKQIEVQTQLEPLFSIEADFTLVHEVLLNLVENAIKYSPPQKTVTIISSESEDHIHVQVIDSGPGIPPEDLPNVWGKFVRGRDQDLKTKGTGLGLYLVKYFVELHGGRVSLQSTFGKGTRIGFSLPLEGTASKLSTD